MKYYPYDTQRRLEEARMAFERLEKAKSPSQIKRAALTFLEQATLSLFPLQKQGQGIENYNEWWVPIGHQLQNNPVSNYFGKLRNNMLKGGQDLIRVSFEINGPGKINGPCQIGGDGILFGTIDKNGVPRWEEKEIDLDLRITTWGFLDCPAEISHITAIELCRTYLNLLEKITSDYVRTFCS